MGVLSDASGIKLLYCKDEITGGSVDRRRSPRICEQFPIWIQGVDTNGRQFHVDTVLDNLSATGLYVCLEHEVKKGARLSMILHMAPVHSPARAARVAAMGVATRTERLPDGKCGIGVAFTQHKFL
jgi:hypothetical protein